MSAPTPVRRSSARDTHRIVLNHYAVPYSCQCADATTTRPALCWQEEEKRTKCILFLSPQRTSFQDELLWLWIPLSTPLPSYPIPSPPPPPPPALSGGKSTDFLCLNGLAKDILIFYFLFFMRKRERRKSTSLFCVLDLYNHFKMAPVLLCFVHERWFESYVGLNEKRWSSLVCQSVFVQKPETLKPLQCSCGWQA